MKTAAYVCFVLAGLGTIAASSNVYTRYVRRPDDFANLFGYAVGSFLLPLTFLIVGLVLLDKHKARVK